MRISDAPDFDGAHRLMAMALVPAPKDMLLQELVALREQCVSKDGGSVDIEVRLQVYRDKLRDFPADCALYVLRKWPEKSKWWPTWHDLYEQLEKLAGDRQAIARALPRVQAQWEADNQGDAR